MFNKETYIERRAQLKKLVKSGIIILFGNNEAPNNYPNNSYYPFRQDSSFLYYFGQRRDGLVGVIDIDNDKEYLVGDDIDIEDIVWYGSVDSVADLAAQVGVANSAPMSSLRSVCCDAIAAKRKIHFLPPYRHDTKIQIMDLLGIHPSKQKEAASVELIMAVVKMRQVKTALEIAEIEKACAIGYEMHTTAMRLTKPGLTEKYIGGQVDGVAHSLGEQVSFATIFTQHGEIMHGTPSYNVLESGRLALCDAGAENAENYCSDNTRTFPVNGKFTQRQLEIYSIVEACHDYVGDRTDEGRHRRGCSRWRTCHVPASRTGPHDGHGRSRHGRTGAELRWLRRRDTAFDAVRNQLSALRQATARRIRDDRRARHLLHTRSHRRLARTGPASRLHQLRPAGDLQGLRRNTP